MVSSWIRYFGLLYFCIFLSLTTYCQYENIWVWNGRNINGLDFNSGNPTPFSSAITGLEAHAMVCDANGRLLFYTNGNRVWNRYNQVMPNGNDLLALSGGVTQPTASTNQGTVIVPIPNDPERYYIFSLVALTAGAAGGHAGELYYSIVDMSLNSNMGDVELNNKGVLLAEDFMEGITAVVGERCNIWLLTLSYRDSSLYAFEITEDEINANPIVSSIGFPTSYIVYIRVSPNNRKIVLGSDNYRLLDFNPSTGEASNMQLLFPNDLYSVVTYPPEFSSDNSKLYASAQFLVGNIHVDSLYKFDITLPTAADIYNQRIAITDAAREMRMGPDGKIYLSRKNNIDRINHPNLDGLACGIQEAVLSNMSIRYGGGPSYVPIIPHHDTFYTVQDISAGCFANVNKLNIWPTNDTSGWDYQWNNGASGISAIADTPGTYWVTYRTSPCNFHIDTFHVRFSKGVLPYIQVDTACPKATNGVAYALTYPGDTVRYSYTWQNEAGNTLSNMDTLKNVSAGHYSVRIQTVECDTSVYFFIPEKNFRLSFEVSEQLICLGDTIALINTSDNHFTVFHWNLDNGDTLEGFGPHSYVYRKSGAYRVMLAGEGTICEDAVYRTVIVDQPVLPGFTVEPKEICTGQPVHFYPRTDSTTVQLVWDIEAQLRIDDNLQHRYQHSFVSKGTFPVTLTLQSRACPDTSVTDSIRVYPYPEVDLGSDSSICLHGQPVFLKNLRQVPLGPYLQVWSTGDTTEVLKVLHPGIYSLSVTTEPIGCTTTEAIEIHKDCYLDIPNAFTPNGDGHNDYFFPRQLLSENISRFHMQVVNRWGQTVFETELPSGRGWDGRLNGKPQPTGVYLYRIEADFANGQYEQYEGNVTLIR